MKDSNRWIDQNRIYYCIQCTDLDTNKTATFGYDRVAYETGKGFHAVTPLFPTLVELFAWARSNGYESEPGPLVHMVLRKVSA